MIAAADLALPIMAVVGLLISGYLLMQRTHDLIVALREWLEGGRR